ncbi:MAG: hypothetical protein P8Y45_02255 [Exilibacterium sp.]
MQNFIHPELQFVNADAFEHVALSIQSFRTCRFIHPELQFVNADAFEHVAFAFDMSFWCLNMSLWRLNMSLWLYRGKASPYGLKNGDSPSILSKQDNTEPTIIISN